MTELVTRRLRLRALATGDAEFVRELVNDPTWVRYIGDRKVRTTADAVAYIEKQREMRTKTGVGVLAVELVAEARAIGLCGLFKREHLPDVDLGFALAASYRGRGLAYEAAQAVMHLARGTLGIKRILAVTHPENTASISLLRKLGFRLQARAVQPGADSDSLVWVAELQSSGPAP